MFLQLQGESHKNGNQHPLINNLQSNKIKRKRERESRKLQHNERTKQCRSAFRGAPRLWETTWRRNSPSAQHYYFLTNFPWVIIIIIIIKIS